MMSQTRHPFRLMTLFLFVVLLYSLYILLDLLQGTKFSSQPAAGTKTMIEGGQRYTRDLVNTLQSLPEQKQTNELPDQIVSIARARKKFLLKLMRENPKYYAEHLLHLFDIPSSIQPSYQTTLRGRGLLEEPLLLNGTLEIIHFSYAPGADLTTYYLIPNDKMTANQRVRLDFAEVPEISWAGQAMSVEGVSLGADLLVPTTGLEPELNGDTRELRGSKKMLVALFSFQNQNSFPFRVTDLESQLFGQKGSVTSYYFDMTERSADLLDTTKGSRVVDIGTLPITDLNCTLQFGIWSSQADERLKQLKIDPAGYDYIVYVFPQAAQCNPSSWSEVSGKRIWVNGGKPATAVGTELRFILSGT